MEENAEIIFQSRQNQKNPNYPDIIQQVDKIISKYKTQLEQLKPRKNLYSLANTNNSFMQEDNINSNTYIKYNNEKKNKSVLTQEMENDNIKLGSALTLEKSKVVQLLNLLKIKENEILYYIFINIIFN